MASRTGFDKVYTVGINDANYAVSQRVGTKQVLCKVYTVWRGMLGRCYDPETQVKNPTYAGVTVDPRWFSFETFRQWTLARQHLGLRLDKDLKVPGNKVYSPGTCLYVTSEVNNLFVGVSAEKLLQLPRGVRFHRTAQKYEARCSDGSRKSVYLGLHSNATDASKAYWEFKLSLIGALADKQADAEVRLALRDWYNRLKADHENT